VARLLVTATTASHPHRHVGSLLAATLKRRQLSDNRLVADSIMSVECRPTGGR
jgi:hypothetical protein